MAKKILPKIIKLPNNAFFKFDAHYRVYISFGAALTAFLITRKNFSWPAVSLISWVTFALAVIIMDWIIILNAHPREIRKIAKLQDSSRTLIFLFVVSASVISLGAILFLLKSTKGQAGADITGHILLAMASVIVSWWLVHTLFTMRYAHMYYDTDTDDGNTKVAGGLQFPDEAEPDYLDFVYFSFVIGMTFQVSDVEISARNIRRLAWMHGLISFAFNTAIVALSINIISSLV
ncbi:DUF1345 domain-containing protein [Mucilaginibacter sp. UR6-11]|uniref:DUF1345 domain-containing protein n=1 Tax=Mucilaginibacter sp. UR6-11 TaxID=1435644 RepID=UPI001E323E4F|nr:DUF1345 domain-containing protein [Mucilaginibacter sp. UR6-11]MCC8425599.1 DUF1345 domain-containing protein [Mucilaginibacter sp. UR6-11]